MICCMDEINVLPKTNKQKNSTHKGKKNKYTVYTKFFFCFVFLIYAHFRIFMHATCLKSRDESMLTTVLHQLFFKQCSGTEETGYRNFESKMLASFSQIQDFSRSTVWGFFCGKFCVPNVFNECQVWTAGGQFSTRVLPLRSHAALMWFDIALPK